MALVWVVVATLAGLASAQLIPEPPVDFDTLKNELLAQGQLEAAEENVQTGLSSPTICDPGVKQHSGYLDAGVGTKYFFWMFESRRSPSKDPLVMWLTGGPGCSSQLALLAENGPCGVSKDGASTVLNKFSWTAQANVMWVDQPAATGFSTGLPTTHNEDGVAANMYRFLQSFYKALPQYQSNDFFIFGESYAGHYVPAVSHYLWQQAKSGGFKVPLKGIGIGNGLTDPEEQYKWYPQMAYDGGKSEGGSLAKGVITNAITHAAMKAATIPCVKKIHSCNANQTGACSSAYATCNYGELIPYQLTGYNPYDMRIKCQKPPLCYDFGNVEAFLNAKKTQQQLGVNKKWGSCNRVVNMAFQGDWMKNYQAKIPDLLADGIQVLVYAGDVDYICNWLGNKKWTLAMEWPHKMDFNAAADQPYNVEGKQVGRLRISNGLHYMQVYQAGHMVPMDQPVAALAMLNDFLSGKMSGAGADRSADQCSGSLDPSGSAPWCYAGKKEALGLQEMIQVKVSDYAQGSGTLDVIASGYKSLSCAGRHFTKKGQSISADLGSCLPSGATISDLKYCSDSDSIVVTLKDSAVPLPLEVTLTKAACPHGDEIVV